MCACMYMCALSPSSSSSSSICHCHRHRRHHRRLHRRRQFRCCRRQNGCTALMLAARHCCCDTARLLIDTRADKEAKDIVRVLFCNFYHFISSNFCQSPLFDMLITHWFIVKNDLLYLRMSAALCKRAYRYMRTL